MIVTSSMPQPTKAELRDWASIGSPVTLIATWDGLNPMTSKAILNALDIEETDHARAIAGEDPDEVWEALT